MLDLRALEKDNGEAYKLSLKNRGADTSIVDKIISLNQERRKLISDTEKQKAEQNKVSQEIAVKKRKGEDANELLESMKQLAQEVKKMEAQVQEAQAAVDELLVVLPNKTHESVPFGKSSEDNKIVRTVGEPKKFSFKPKEHAELGETLGMLDFERAAKVTGARFTILRNDIAHLERALLNFMLDLHTMEHGYEETIPPFIVNSKSLFGTSQLPKFSEDLFHLENTDYYLIPTAEVPVTNYFSQEILDAEMLPVSFAAYTPCFRSEAGSYGKDTKGLIRQHQFNKVELVKFVRPETSYDEHELLVSHAETVLKRLELPYRVALLCSGDIGFGAAKCYDLEVWLPGQNAYREISSCSNFEDFQSRRAGIRFKEKGGKPQFVHTLNGSGLAIGRTLVAILENYQQEDGSVLIPKVLQKYMHGKEHITAKKI